MEMLKIADADMAAMAEELLGLDASKKKIESRMEVLKSSLKNGMSERSSTNAVFGGVVVTVTKVAGTLTPDVDKMKEDGIYVKYSKPKAGYTKLSVSRHNPEGAF